MSEVIIKPGREKSVKNRHPWLFSGSIKNIEGSPANGDIVEVRAQDGTFLARGFYNANSKMLVRLFSFNEADVVDRAFWKARIEQALQLRTMLIEQKTTNAFRVVHGEGDFLPGLVIDTYAGHCVVQFSTLGMYLRRGEIMEVLSEVLRPKSIIERSDALSFKLEGIVPEAPYRTGDVPENVTVLEHGLSFKVDLLKGQKTGFFLDQRDNRLKVKELAVGRRVLNCFSYSGGFTVYAAAGGAKSTVSVDISKDAVDLARENCSLNGFTGAEHQFIAADAFEYLRTARKDRQKFDLVILDPPAFVKSKATIMPGARGYKDVNLQAIKLVEKNGLFITCSCSHHIDRMLFQKIVHDAAIDAGRDLQILEFRGQAPDHPINHAHPEGEYLKCLVCRVI